MCLARNQGREEGSELLVTASVFVAERQADVGYHETGGANQVKADVHSTKLEDPVRLDPHLSKLAQSDDRGNSNVALYNRAQPVRSSGYSFSNFSSRRNNSAQVSELNGGFMILFEDIWRIKDKINRNLVKLDYFTVKNRVDNETSDERALNLTIRQHANNQPAINGSKVMSFPPPKFNSTLNGSRLLNRPPNGPKNLAPASNRYPTTLDSSKMGSTVKTNQIGPTLGSQMSVWLQQLGKKISMVLGAIVSPLTNKLQQSPRTSKEERLESSKADDNEDKLDLDRAARATLSGTKSRSLFKRNADQRNPGTMRNEMQNSGRDRCIELSSNQLKKCRTVEQLVSLNVSFPGTSAAIEDNCRQITFLLANCWPNSLQQIRSSLVSWNKSVVLATEFQLPTSQSYGQEMSCGSQSQVPNFMLDRINWMWLNLCMDKKFRLEYVENLRCLSMWNQGRAQQACSNEYRRMQSNVVSKVHDLEHSHGSLRRALISNSIEQNSMLAGSNLGANQRAEQTLEPTQEGGELESKTLCCSFDLFLRCVHKQAVRDCGRNGGQFVVDFMSRIGMDDMKYICNSEPRATQRLKQLTTRKGNLEIKGPFIEGDYCNEPRVYNTLNRPNKSSSAAGNRTGGSRPTNAKNSNRPSTNINSDSTMSGQLGMAGSDGYRIPFPTLSCLLTLWSLIPPCRLAIQV